MTISFPLLSINPYSQNTPNMSISFRNYSSKCLSNNQYSQNAPEIRSLRTIISRNYPPKFHLFTTPATPTGSHSTDPVEVQRRTVLSEELSSSTNVVRLSCDSTVEGGSCNVYLVGTSHGSQESCNEVQAIINYLKPQVVFLELCASRTTELTNWKSEVPTIEEMINETRKKPINTFEWLLDEVYEELDALGMITGSEFSVAYDEAMKYGGTVVLGDRPVDITFRRTWEKMPFGYKVKLFSWVSLSLAAFKLLRKHEQLMKAFDLKRRMNEKRDIDRVASSNETLSKEFPTMFETLLNERDRYMAYELHRVASKNSSVVAVVGKAHLHGMKKQWLQPVNIEEIMQLPPEKPIISAVKIAASLGAVYAAVTIIKSFYPSE